LKLIVKLWRRADGARRMLKDWPPPAKALPLKKSFDALREVRDVEIPLRELQDAEDAVGRTSSRRRKRMLPVWPSLTSTTTSRMSSSSPASRRVRIPSSVGSKEARSRQAQIPRVRRRLLNLVAGREVLELAQDGRPCAS